MPQEDDTALEEPDTEIDHSGKPKPNLPLSSSLEAESELMQ
jgi:hypothetical protein